MSGQQPFPLLIRADATPGMGCGHVMRCRALAAAARAVGMPVVMSGHCETAWLRPLLEREGYLFQTGSPPSPASPAALLSQLKYMARRVSRSLRDSIVLLDGYHFGTECQTAVRNAVRALVVLDDYRHLPCYECDILVNQNPGSEEYDYTGPIGSKLLGLDYALLRPEFASPPSPSGKADAILLSLGGGDFSDLLPGLTPALSPLAGRTLKVIAGSVPPARLHTALHQGLFRLDIVSRVDDMSALLADTQLCISAGGSTCWELCRMGVPFLTVEVAENQRRICDWLDTRGLAPRFSTPALAALVNDAALRSARAATLRQLVDGRGAERVLRHVLELKTVRM